MSKERTNIYITERQMKQLEKRSQEEGLPHRRELRGVVGKKEGKNRRQSPKVRKWKKT